MLIAFHVVMLLLLIAVIDSGIILRWRLGYVLFGLAALSGIALFFVNFNKAVLDAMIKLYAFCCGVLTIIGCIVCFLTFDKVYCETDRYILKEPGAIIGFDTAILYEKVGIKEIERYRYKGVYPYSFEILDSIGAIIITGDWRTVDVEQTEYATAILPLDPKIYDYDKVKEYARKHNIRFEYE